MIEFLTENWKLIAILGAILVELVLLLIFKKKPQVLDNSLIFDLCTWIAEAENLYSVGSDKLHYVLTKAKVRLGDLFDEKSVTKIIEWLLTLPEKKEKK